MQYSVRTRSKFGISLLEIRRDSLDAVWFVRLTAAASGAGLLDACLRLQHCGTVLGLLLEEQSVKPGLSGAYDRRRLEEYATYLWNETGIPVMGWNHTTAEAGIWKKTEEYYRDQISADK